jgi:hypothetical protein
MEADALYNSEFYAIFQSGIRVPEAAPSGGATRLGRRYRYTAFRTALLPRMAEIKRCRMVEIRFARIQGFPENSKKFIQESIFSLIFGAVLSKLKKFDSTMGLARGVKC